jgi:hypothetical protein
MQLKLPPKPMTHMQLAATYVAIATCVIVPAIGVTASIILLTTAISGAVLPFILFATAYTLLTIGISIGAGRLCRQKLFPNLEEDKERIAAVKQFQQDFQKYKPMGALNDRGLLVLGTIDTSSPRDATTIVKNAIIFMINYYSKQPQQSAIPMEYSAITVQEITEHTRYNENDGTWICAPDNQRIASVQQGQTVLLPLYTADQNLNKKFVALCEAAKSSQLPQSASNDRQWQEQQEQTQASSPHEVTHLTR